MYGKEVIAVFFVVLRSTVESIMLSLILLSRSPLVTASQNLNCGGEMRSQVSCRF